MPKLMDRSTGDLLVLVVAFTICFSVLATGAGITVGKILNPDVNVSQVVGALTDVLNTLIGLLAGFLAGRSDTELTVKKTEERVRNELSG